MPMECKDVLELLDSYLDGELSPSDTERVRAHLAVCPECREELEERRTMAALLCSSDLPFPEDLHDRIMQAVREKKSGRRWHRVRKVLAISSRVAVAATVVLLALPLILHRLPRKSGELAPLYPELMSADDGLGFVVELYPAGYQTWESRTPGFATDYRFSYVGDVAVLTVDGYRFSGRITFEENGKATLCLEDQRIFRLVPSKDSEAILLIPEA